MDKLLLGWRILVRGDERKLTNMAATQFRVAANILLYRLLIIDFARPSWKCVVLCYLVSKI